MTGGTVFTLNGFIENILENLKADFLKLSVYYYSRVYDMPSVV